MNVKTARPCLNQRKGTVAYFAPTKLLSALLCRLEKNVAELSHPPF